MCNEVQDLTGLVSYDPWNSAMTPQQKGDTMERMPKTVSRNMVREILRVYSDQLQKQLVGESARCLDDPEGTPRHALPPTSHHRKPPITATTEYYVESRADLTYSLEEHYCV